MPQQSATTQQIMTASQLAAMSPADRAAYFSSLPAPLMSGEQAAYQQYVAGQNAQYMALAIKRLAPMIPAGGGVNAAYSAGTALTYEFPTAGGAWAEAIVVTCNLTVTCAAGTGATYAVNQFAQLALFDRCQIMLNGIQHNFRPYILRYVSGLLRGYSRSLEPSSVLSGTQDANIQNVLNGPIPVATGANTWKFVFRIPLAPLNENSPYGMLPMMSAGTKPQLVLTCAPAPLGNDPILNAVATTAGTGAAVTVTGTVQADVEYRDGTNLWSPTALSLDLSSEPTVQYIEDQTISNLVAGNINRGRIATLLQHYLVLDVVVDGQVQGKTAQISNISVAQLDMDSVGQNSFYKFGSASGTNLSLFDFYERMRRQYGQDIEEGVFPWIVGWGNHTNNADNREGQAALNMMIGGWPDVNTAYQLAAVGAQAGVAPRVNRHLVSLNPAGLQLVLG
ncbi:MAG: hypothetical protein IVW55_12215 [Chloroflexi bacterium]|nr:hypothetical protein [Chloroflexota bacterium]